MCYSHDYIEAGGHRIPKPIIVPKEISYFMS